jgi:hypothetical protein
MAITKEWKLIIAVLYNNTHFCSNLPWYFNLRSNKVKIAAVIWRKLFYNIGPRIHLKRGLTLFFRSTITWATFWPTSSYSRQSR